MSNEHTVKSYEEELQNLKDSLIKMGSLTESQMSDSMDAIIKVDKDSIDKLVKLFKRSKDNNSGLSLKRVILDRIPFYLKRET